VSEALADKRHAPDHRIERLYRRWSKGGYGLIVTGNVMVDGAQLGEPGNIVIEDDRHLAALSRWARVTKDAGIPTWVQPQPPASPASSTRRSG